jgi:hypothetical protein
MQGDSNPDAVVRRDEYHRLPGVTVPALPPVAAKNESAEASVSEDEYSDEFGDESEFVHATVVGKKLAESVENPCPVRSAGKIVEIIEKPKRDHIINPEPLDSPSLADSGYDSLLEPSDCVIRVFGQTEVCESVVSGSKRSGSEWMVNVLNGFLRDNRTGEEFLFRQFGQAFPHSHQKY